MRVPSAGRHRWLAAVAAIAGLALLAFTTAPAPAEHPAPATANSYVAFAGRLQTHLGGLWNERLGRYDPGRGSTTTSVNADLLLVHSLAALDGAQGPTRNDARARAIARFLVGPQVWSLRPPRGADPQVTGPGWVSAPGRSQRHPVFDSEVADGLAHAYLARTALGLDAATVARIRDEIHLVATSADWRWPALRLNQLNWYCQIFAADAIVNGARRTLATGMSRHLARFLRGATAHGATAGNLGPGLRFHYLPHRGPRSPANLDSPEYANIVLGFSRFYGLARDAGMRPPARIGLLREWVRRVLAGSWTHAGYLNWDTGLGFSRWHARKKVALAQQALIGVASQPELQPGRRWGAWAKWLFDRGLATYDALVQRESGIPAALAYGVDTIPQSRGAAYLAAARFEANAMRALEAGLDRMPASRPPALYAYDPDIGRLAVTTPAYNTAIVAVNQGAFPYGGLDIARLFDGRQEVAANIGGRGTAAFGLHVTRHGREVVSTQYGDRDYQPGVTPLRLTRAPRGAGVRASAAVGRAYAAPFTDLRVEGSVRGATAAYRFTPRRIDARWTASAPAGAVAAVTFPSWGRGAHVIARLRDGRTVPLGPAPVALSGVASLHIVSARSGYVVTPRPHPAGAIVRLIPGRRQSSDPNPGPTVQVRLGTGPTTLAVRIGVDQS